MAGTLKTKNITTVDTIQEVQDADKVFVNNNNTLKQVSITDLMQKVPESEETDPTVPSWAKQPTKPTYTADEVGARSNTWVPSAEDVGALPSDTTIPTKTSQLENDSNFATEGDIPDIPDKLPNPEKLIFSGAVTDEYDGTSEKTIHIPIEQNILEKSIENYYALRRTGKVYQTKLWKIVDNPTSEGVKQLDNAGLVFEPSTDTEEGQDDYLNGQHPLFEWVHCNYIRDADGTARPIAIEGMDTYKTTGAVDVGAMQMSFWINWDTSNAEYDTITISDLPHPELGLVPWKECEKTDGTVVPWCIGSAYVSGEASDGLPRSQPGLVYLWKQSHNSMIVDYQEKGEGYWGAGACRNAFQFIFNAIKGNTKNSQTLYAGCTSYNYQYDAAVQSAEAHTYFPVTNDQVANLIVGSRVSVGYASNNNGALNKDRGQTTVHEYAERVKIIKIEDLDENNKAVYLDIPEESAFSTTSVQLTETLTSPIMLSTMPWDSGETDKVMGHHDGSPVSNTNGKYPYRVQGREYAIGTYIVASDTVIDLQADYTKHVLVAPKGVAHSTSDATIRNTYTNIGTIPAASAGNNADWWVGDININNDTGSWYPAAEGSSSSQGCGDRVYAGGTGATSGLREYLQGGLLGGGSYAGSVCLACWGGLGYGSWGCAACD